MATLTNKRRTAFLKTFEELIAERRPQWREHSYQGTITFENRQTSDIECLLNTATDYRDIMSTEDARLNSDYLPIGIWIERGNHPETHAKGSDEPIYDAIFLTTKRTERAHTIYEFGIVYEKHRIIRSDFLFYFKESVDMASIVRDVMVRRLEL